jgi:hypothetical protein
MPDLHDLDPPLRVVNGVDDPVVSLGDTIAVLPRQLLA